MKSEKRKTGKRKQTGSEHCTKNCGFCDTFIFPFCISFRQLPKPPSPPSIPAQVYAWTLCLRRTLSSRFSRIHRRADIPRSSFLVDPFEATFYNRSVVQHRSCRQGLPSAVLRLVRRFRG